MYLLEKMDGSGPSHPFFFVFVNNVLFSRKLFD